MTQHSNHSSDADEKNNDTDNQGFLTAKRRTVLAAIGVASVAGCAQPDTPSDSTVEDNEVTVTKDDDVEYVSAEEIGGDSSDVSTDGEPNSQVDSDSTDGVDEDVDTIDEADEPEEQSSTDDQSTDDGADETENTEDVENEDETDSDTTKEDAKDKNEEDKEDKDGEDEDEEETESDEVTVDEIVENHKQAVKEVNYEADIMLQGEQSPQTVSNSLVYAEREISTGREVSIRQSSTRDNGVDYIQHVFDGSDQRTEVEFDDGDVATGSIIGEELDTDMYPDSITGSGLLRRLVSGATLTALRLPEDESGTTGEYEITGHNLLTVKNGELVIDASNMVTEFTVEWVDNSGVTREVRIDVSRLR